MDTENKILSFHVLRGLYIDLLGFFYTVQTVYVIPLH